MEQAEIRNMALRIVDHYGTEHQKKKSIEELSELITELAREQDGRTDVWTICAEIADAFIVLEQLRIIYGANKVDTMVHFKLGRTMGEIAKEIMQQTTEEGTP